MTHVTPEYVKGMQIKHNTPYWKITDKTKKTVINRNQNENLNFSIDELQDALNISGDYVIVFLYTHEPKSTKPGDERGQSFELMVKLADNYNYQHNKGINGAPIDLLLKMNDEKHAQILENERLKYERKEEPQKHWILELATTFPEVTNGAISFCKYAGSKLLDKLETKTNTGINGPAKKNAELEAVLKKFEDIDPDYVQVLQRMANFVVGDKEQYLAFKRKLLFDV